MSASRSSRGSARACLGRGAISGEVRAAANGGGEARSTEQVLVSTTGLHRGVGMVPRRSGPHSCIQSSTEKPPGFLLLNPQRPHGQPGAA